MQSMIDPGATLSPGPAAETPVTETPEAMVTKVQPVVDEAKAATEQAEEAAGTEAEPSLGMRIGKASGALLGMLFKQ